MQEVTNCNKNNPGRTNFGLTQISDAAYDDLSIRLGPVRNWVNDTEAFIKEAGLDHDTFSPIWGEETLRLVAEGLLTKNRAIIERLRLIWWFTGWPTNHYSKRETFPILDPTYLRYQKLKTITPKRFQYAAPALFGEAGWVEDEGVVNHDVAIFQERLQFLYFSGVSDFLDKNENCMTLELGGGYGAMSYNFLKSFPAGRHVLCDIPQSLAVSFCYLNVTLPDANHFAVTTDGIYHINTPGKKVSVEEAFHTPGAFIYIPNYLLPMYEPFLQPSMIFNAMSLHEMHQKASDYYCKAAVRLLEKHQGVFCEFNTLTGGQNVLIDDKLRRNFKHCLEIDLPSLACRPRIWSTHHNTIAQISAVYNSMQAKFPLDNMFEFDSTVEFPFVEDAVIREMVKDQLGKYLGSAVRVLPVGDNEPFYGNHLRHIVSVRKKMIADGMIAAAMEKFQEGQMEKAKIQVAHNQIVELKQVINELQASRSWRYTLWLRKTINYFRSFRTKLQILSQS
jgi:putative sugar O-methyltransferase